MAGWRRRHGRGAGDTALGRGCSRVVCSMLAAAALSLVGGGAVAGEPEGRPACTTLAGDEAEQSAQALERAEASLAAGEGKQALAATLEVEALCAMDVSGLGLLARSYEAAGQCHMARYTYERLLAGGDRDAGLDDGERGRFLEVLTRLEPACPDSVRVQVVAPSEATVSLQGTGWEPTFWARPPFEGRVAAGRYVLTVQMKGRLDFVQETTFEKGVRHVVVAPPLGADHEGPLLRLRCRADDRVHVVGAAGEAVLTCPHEGLLDTGETRVAMDVDGNRFETVVSARQGDVAEVRVPVPTESRPGLTLADWGWVLAGSGAGLALAGTGMAIAGLSLRDEVASPAPVDGNGAVLRLSQREAEEALSRAKSLHGAGVAVGVVGALALGAGVALVLWPDDPFAVEVLPAVTGNAGVLQVRTVF